MDVARKAKLVKVIATTQLMVALLEGVVNADVVLSLKLFLATMLILQA